MCSKSVISGNIVISERKMYGILRKEWIRPVLWLQMSGKGL